MDQILEQVRDLAEGQIDFEGQRLADLLVNICLSLISAIAFIVGYFLQDIKLALYIAMGGSALVFVLVVPAWPFFNRNPVKWLPVGGGKQAQHVGSLVIDEKAI